MSLDAFLIPIATHLGATAVGASALHWFQSHRAGLKARLLKAAQDLIVKAGKVDVSTPLREAADKVAAEEAKALADLNATAVKVLGVPPQ